MTNIKNEYTLTEIIKNNYSHEIIYDYTDFNLPIKSNECISVIVAQKNANKQKSIELISNPIIIFELYEDEEFEFDLDYLFNTIEINIGSVSVDKIYDIQIKIYNIVYGLNIKKIGSKIYYPIPFSSLVNGNGIINSKCKYNDVRFNIKFNKHDFIRMIKFFTIRIELLSSSYTDIDTNTKLIDYKIYNNENHKFLSNYFNSNYD